MNEAKSQFSQSETISSFWTQRAHGAAFGELGGTRCILAREPCAHHGHSEQLQTGRQRLQGTNAFLQSDQDSLLSPRKI